MDMSKRLAYITENSDALTKEEQSQIARISLKLKARNAAKVETEATLGDLKWLYSDLLAKKLTLDTLMTLLAAYQNQKGLKSDLLSADTLIAMIQSDITAITQTHDVIKSASENMERLMQGATVTKA